MQHEPGQSVLGGFSLMMTERCADRPTLAYKDPSPPSMIQFGQTAVLG